MVKPSEQNGLGVPVNQGLETCRDNTENCNTFSSR